MRLRVPLGVRTRFGDELAAAVAARSQGRVVDAWSALEAAHIVSQPWALLHLRSHLEMLLLAVHTGDGREAAGQVARLVVAAPGSLSGRYPTGNTGRARVSMFAPMPVPDELAEVIEGSAAGS